MLAGVRHCPTTVFKGGRGLAGHCGGCKPLQGRAIWNFFFFFFFFFFHKGEEISYDAPSTQNGSSQKRGVGVLQQPSGAVPQG